MRISRKRLIGAAALLAISIGTASAQTPSCNISYTKSWESAPGFGANIIITNSGPAISGWTLLVNFPGTQRLQGGWPVAFSQPAGSNVLTIASNADWNRNIASGGTFNVGFNGTFTGTNAIPTQFTLNGTACSSGNNPPPPPPPPPANPPPTVILTSPTSGQTFPQGTTVPLAATATDNTGVARVEFRVDGNLVNSDTTSPYGFNVVGLAVGNHTAQATAFDNAATPASAQSLTVPFSVTPVVGTGTITASATTLTVPSTGGTTTSVIRLAAAPTQAVTVTLTRSGSTVTTVSPGTITFPNTGTLWQTGVTATFTTAAGTTAATSTFALAAPNFTGTNITVNRQAPVQQGVRADNPYVGATVYNNPQWRASAVAGGGNAIANQPTGVWFDRISAIDGNGSATTGSMGLAAHLDEALRQDAANGANTALVFQMVVYDLPGRDCAALASNGELGPTELDRYKTAYINHMRDILALPQYASLRIVAIIEIDSLPNLVTNKLDRPTGTMNCQIMADNGNYVNGVGYALATLGAIPNVYNYVDAGHHGWLGWNTNFGPAVTMMMTAARASGATPANVWGFITNTANTSALVEPFITLDATTRTSHWIDFNDFNDELSFATAWRNEAVRQGFDANIGMLIDTSRNGWGGPARPTGPSTLADLNARIDASRIDRRIHKGNWCNPSGAGLGERPRAQPANGIDAYVWIKPPGESDGASSLIPNDEGKGFDAMCAPGNPNNPRNNFSETGALPNAPLSGHWFQFQFTQLMQNAFPPL